MLRLWLTFSLGVVLPGLMARADSPAQRVPPLPVHGASLVAIQRYNDRFPDAFNYGDTFYCTWDADDQVYIVTDDTGGWDKRTPWAGGGAGSNVMVGRIEGRPDDPAHFRGIDINLLNGPNQFGGAGAISGPDRRTWKGWGIISVDGVLYLCVARTWGFGSGPPPAGVPWSNNATIIKSPDSGKTWLTPVGQTNVAPDPTGPAVLFPGGRFGTPAFVQYGKDGATPRVDRADEFLYLYSPDIDHYDGLYLGRVHRPVRGQDDPVIDKRKWQFYRGGDGADDANWTADLNAARPFYSGPLTSHGDMAYDVPLRCYLMLNYDSYPAKKPATYRISVAPHPWGPWKSVWQEEFKHYYGQPTLPAKFISQDGRTLWVFTSDDFTTAGKPPDQTRYCLHMMKVVLIP